MLYVDNARIPFQHMKMSHLMADTPKELQDAETSLGIPKGSIQNPGQPNEHLDISHTKRREAITLLAANEVSSRQLVRMVQAKRAKIAAEERPDQTT